MRVQVAAFLLAFMALGLTIPPFATSAQTPPVPSNKPVPSDTADPGDTAGRNGVPAAANGAEQDFTIVNNTGHTIKMLNVSPSNEDNWGPNILDGDKLGNGKSAGITFDRGEAQCKWDIRATYEDGGVTDLRDVNLCEVLTVTLTP